MLWLEAFGAILLAACGAVAGLLCARLRRPYWTLGYFVPLLAIVLVVLVLRVDALAFVAPFSWLAAGRNEFLVIVAACPMVLATPLSRLPHRRQKIAVGAFAVAASAFVTMPFLLPAFLRGQFSRMPTNLDHRGICLQSTIYTCGPAAAVTALRRLGLPAEEGELAILGRTNPLTGTGPDSLRLALNERYGAEGLVATYRRFRNVEELKAAGPTLAVIKLNLLVDHYVAVLEVSDAEVTVGDPLAGRRRLSWAEFESVWRHAGVVLKLRGLQAPAASDP